MVIKMVSARLSSPGDFAVGGAGALNPKVHSEVGRAVWMLELAEEGRWTYRQLPKTVVGSEACWALLASFGQVTLLRNRPP